MSEDIGNAIDPLNMDLSKAETKFPIIVPGPYTFQVGKMEVKAGKKDASTKNLSIELKLTQPAQTREGATVQPGFPIYHNITLTPVGKLTQEMIQRSLAQFMESTLGHHNGAFGPLEQYQGQTLTARVKIESSTEYGDQNRIDAFIKKS